MTASTRTQTLSTDIYLWQTTTLVCNCRLEILLKVPLILIQLFFWQLMQLFTSDWCPLWTWIAKTTRISKILRKFVRLCKVKALLTRRRSIKYLGSSGYWNCNFLLFSDCLIKKFYFFPIKSLFLEIHKFVWIFKLIVSEYSFICFYGAGLRIKFLFNPQRTTF